MRVFASLLAASVALAAPVAAAAAPARVASLNLCTDELLLMLGAPEQIVSVTHLSHQEAETPLWREGRRYARNDGSLLSVAGLHPDLVLTMGGGGRDRGRIAERLGIRVVDLPFPTRLADIEASISEVSRVLGRPERGAALLARIDALKRSTPAQPREAIWIGGGGISMSGDGLGAQWLALAGLRQRTLPGNRATLETLLAHPPEVLVRSDYRAGQYSGQQRWLGHPLARAVRGGRSVQAEGRRWTCMGPLLIDEIVRLRGELAQ